jgi:hypothetical protein
MEGDQPGSELKEHQGNPYPRLNNWAELTFIWY